MADHTGADRPDAPDDSGPPLRDTDPLLRAARYRAEQEERPDESFTDAAQRVHAGPEGAAPQIETTLSADDDVAEVANRAIDQAMARGDFDDLEYAGRPLPGLGGTYDPDWWIKGLIERENLSGLGPPALLLRREAEELQERLDRLGTERQVREALEDFNGRVVEARRQLLGGPPVVTPTRDVDEELRGWRGRRDERAARAEERARRSAEAERAARRPWWRLRRRPLR
ncbi:hypothetical protein GCM10022377_17190 [Zhihengliuella alba]|uniref:DnaJ homologue subfamily C member 28 conserved domain-containing protein n=1 Tax=Zhihengliuella alba TaxID=547018 RepID=A0ABP7DGL1_9MICC